jgi:hypothetical protein
LRRAVYSTTCYDDDPEYTDDPDADGGYQVYSMDTDIADINAHAVCTNRVNNNMSSSNCVPMAEWIKMTKEEIDRLIAKSYQEKAHNKGGNKKPVQATRRANMHSIDSSVDLDAIIEYSVMEHKDHTRDDDADKDDNAESTDLLAYMAGQHSSSGDIREVPAAKKVPSKQKSREGNLAPSSLSFNGDTYYLNKGETITFQGHQYTAHVTKFNYQVSQHDVTDMDYVFVD